MTTTWSALAGSSLSHPPSSTAACVPKQRLITRLVLLKSGEVASFTVIVGKVPTLLTSIILVKVLIRFN